MTQQKFKRGDRVTILNAEVRRTIKALPHGEIIGTLPSHRDIFGNNEGIVVASYMEQFGDILMTHDQPGDVLNEPDESHTYTLHVLNAASKIVDTVSWFDEEQLAILAPEEGT